MKVFSPKVQFLLASAFALLGLMILVTGAIWTRGCVSEAIADVQLPLKLPAILLLVVALGWMTDLASQGDTTRVRLLGWAFALLWLATITVWQTLYHCSVLPSLPFASSSFAGFQMSALLSFVPIVVWAVMAFFFEARRRGDSSGGTEASLFEHWGHIAPLIIMLVALFAYGLERLPDGTLSVRWEEIPAILVVFVLAELGVRLVVAAQGIGQRVDATTEWAARVADQAKKLTAEAKELGHQEAMLAKDIKEISGIKAVTNSSSYRRSENLITKMGYSPSEKYWETLGTFVASWDIDMSPNHSSKDMLRILFEGFVGKGPSDGSVRTDQKSVQCITADTVYMETSQNWLAEMTGQHMKAKTGKLLVWAVSRLLPTEFALPAIWLKSGSDPSARSRVASLESFISTVIASCANGAGDVEYRRVTVFDDADEFQALCDPYQVEPHSDGTPSQPKKSCALDDCLDQWLIWDRRSLPKSSLAMDVGTANGMTNDVVRRLLSDGAHKDYFDHTERTLTREQVGKLPGADKWVRGSERILPVLPRNQKDVQIRRYDTYFGCDAASDHEHSDECKGSVLVALQELLDMELKADEVSGEMKGSSYEAPVRRFFQDSQTPKTLIQFLRAVGWRTLREWYCNGMHVGSDGHSPAWWAVKSDGHRAAKGEVSHFTNTFFKPLELSWNGTNFLTLDVLLIGSERQGNPRYEWHGAIISNLSLDRTECTIQLNVDPQQLREVAHVVQEMCGDNSRFSGLWEKPVVSSHPI